MPERVSTWRPLMAHVLVGQMSARETERVASRSKRDIAMMSAPGSEPKFPLAASWSASRSEADTLEVVINNLVS